MSDHESESEANATFSTNGSDPSGIAASSEDGGEGTAFLAELARAMQTTAAAEQARNAETTEQRRQTHIDAIRAREALEAEDLRELAKEDVKGIDAWSDGEIKRIKLERERRIAARREQLQVRLEEHRSVVSREVDAVEAAIASYRADIELYFRRLESETDPVAIAMMARTRPQFPELEQIGPDEAAATSVYQSPSPVYGYQVSSAAVSTSDTTVSDVPADEAPADEAPTAEAQTAEAPVAEAAPAESPAAESQVAVAVADDVTTPEPSQDEDTPSASVDEPSAESSMVGVMDHEAASESPDTGWDTGSEAVAEQTPDATPEETAPVSEGSETGEPADGSPEPEPVAAAAEARIVMPRSTGTGSWLRWPNSTTDRSDQPR
jgi:hypothetical protein